MIVGRNENSARQSSPVAWLAIELFHRSASPAERRTQRGSPTIRTAELQVRRSAEAERAFALRTPAEQAANTSGGYNPLMAEKPPTVLDLVWEHDLVFAGKSGDVRMTLDSASKAGPSPMQALAFGLAGCMAMDVVHILRKGRHDLRGLRADLKGMRAAREPRRFTAIELHYTLTGAVPQDQVQRAIDLSREKYCSVWHSLRQDIDFRITFKVEAGV